MGRIYYLNREETSFENVLSYLKEQLVYNKNSTNFKQLGIDFKDVKNGINETFELYLNAEQRQQILNESKNIDYDNNNNLLNYKDNTKLCFYKKGKWSVYLAVCDGYLEWTLSGHFIEDGNEKMQSVCGITWDTRNIDDLAQTDLYKYAKEEFENFKPIRNMREMKMNYNKLTKQELIDLLTEIKFKLEEIEEMFDYECECNEQFIKIQNELEKYQNKEKQDVLDEITFRENFFKTKYNFTNDEIDRIVQLYKELLGEDTTWNTLLNRAINDILKERNTTYEVHILNEDGTTKDRYDFKKITDAIKYYNTLNTDKELVRNIADEDFDTLYRYYTDDEGCGVKTINYKYMEED